MFYTETMTLEQLINNIKTNEKRLSFCVYGAIPSEDATLATYCVIDDYPQISDNDEEIFPVSVVKAGLKFWYRDELLEDVIVNATSRNPEITNEKILKAVNHYDEHDTFMQPN